MNQHDQANDLDGFWRLGDDTTYLFSSLEPGKGALIYSQGDSPILRFDLTINKTESVYHIEAVNTKTNVSIQFTVEIIPGGNAILTTGTTQKILRRIT